MKHYVFDESRPFYTNAYTGVKLFRGICTSRNNREVILKSHTFNPQARDCDLSLSRALNAAVAQAKVHHPHTCDLLEVHFRQVQGQFVVYHILESLTGTLNDEIDRRSADNTPCTEAELRTFLQQTSAALAYTHSKEVAHRDIKPQNIFCTESCYKIGDFGTFFFKRDLTCTETVEGTPRYYSPQMQEKRFCKRLKYNPFMSDVYALGVTFFKLAALDLPKAFDFPYEREEVKAAVAELAYSQLLKDLLLSMLVYEETHRPSMQQVYNTLVSELPHTSVPEPSLESSQKELSLEPQPACRELVCVERDAVRVFDLHRRKWIRSPLTTCVKADSCTQYVWTERTLFCSGGFSEGESTREAYLLESGSEWTATPLADMLVGRHYHGLWWAAAQRAVLVFGGEAVRRNSTTNLAVCESWHSSQWQALPSMAQPRWCFNPCEFHSTLYLCGGYTDLIETFNPQTSTFSQLQARLPDRQSTAVTFIARDQLVVLSWNHVTCWGPCEELLLKQLSKCTHPEFGVWGNMAPVLETESGPLLVSSKGACWSIQIDGSGRKRIAN